jgi:hypothetical protein
VILGKAAHPQRGSGFSDHGGIKDCREIVTLGRFRVFKAAFGFPVDARHRSNCPANPT